MVYPRYLRRGREGSQSPRTWCFPWLSGRDGCVVVLWDSYSDRLQRFARVDSKC